MGTLIGITANYVKDSQFGMAAHIGGPGQFWQALADDYVQAISRAGGVPVLLPVLPNPEDSQTYLDKLDGILFSGGCDMSPLSFGENTTSKIGEVCAERDEQELTLIRAALAKSHFPVLGICRGCQLLNVALGGTLILDIDTSANGDHFFSQQRMSVLTHQIETVSGSLIKRLMETETRVNSYHHQCVATLGDGVVITASDCHGIPECLEVPGREGFTLATQWHPEGLALVNDHHLNIFKAFVQAASEHKNRG